MLLKPFGNRFDNNEENSAYLQSYVGEVIDNNDPEKLKRVKVHIDLWDYMTTEELPWVTQKGNGAIGNAAGNSQHDIPEVGSQVSISFPSGDPENPQYEGVETTAENKCSLFDEDYPNTYGRKDSDGSFTITNKSTGITVKQHKSGTQLQIDPDGTATLTMPSGAYAYCDAAGNWFFKGPTRTIAMDDEIKLASNTISLMADKLNLKGGFVDIDAENELRTNSPTTRVNAKASINLNAPKTETTGAFVAGNGVSGIFMDLIGMTTYKWDEGVLTNITKG